jgi:hypothetical protein
MSEKNNSNSSGIGLGGALLVLFVALKLTEVIDWSWWWVLSPVLIPLGIAAFCFLILGAISMYEKKIR